MNFHPAPRWNVTCAHGWQDGGGLYISGVSTILLAYTSATLTNAKVYANLAGIDVCSSFEHKLNDHPAPLKFYRSIICPQHLTFAPLTHRVATSTAPAPVFSLCGTFMSPRPRPRVHPAVCSTWGQIPSSTARSACGSHHRRCLCPQ